MEKIAQRNIMAINEDWRIFRKILKGDLALDRTTGRWCMALSERMDVFNLVSESMPQGMLVSGGGVGEPKG